MSLTGSIRCGLRAFFQNRLSIEQKQFPLRFAFEPKFRPKWTACLFATMTVLAGHNAMSQRPLGIDVSSYQGSADNPPTTINWTSVKGSSSGAYAWAKATEGLTYIDADFTYNVTQAKSAGVPIGAYHFAHPDTHPGTSGADSEATYFWNEASPYIIAGGSYCMPMLDAEVASPGTKTAVSQWVNEWCNDIVSLGSNNGVVLKPIVYTYQSWATSYLDSTVTGWPLWMAASLNGQSPQTGAPASIAPWSTWAFWQYGQGTVSGIEGACDEDVFNGTLAGFTSTYIVVSSAPTITSLTTNQTVWQGSNTTFSVTAPTSVSYQWVFNNKNIANATGSSLTLANCQISNAGPYYVVANGAHASSTSSVVFLSVLPLLTNAPNAALIPSNMVDWWPANGNANDIYGTNHGTPAGGFTYTNGHTGLAFRFDGSSARVTTTAGNLAPPWTACMWVNYSHTSQSSAGLLEDGVYGLKLEQKGSATHNVGISQSNYLDSVFNYAAPTNTWTHLAFVASTTNVTLYANGVNEGSITTNTMPLPRAYIGAGHSSVSGNYIDFMLGSLDDVMIYSRALSSNEINNIYNAGSASLVCAPHIVGGQATTNGHFNLNVEGVTGKNFNILVSTNLTTWQSVGALTNPNGTNTYVVPNIHKYNQIYFSISQPY